MNRLAFIAAVLAVTLQSGCGDFVRTNPLDPSYPMTVALAGPDSVFSINDTIQFQIVTDPIHPNLPFVWTSSNPSVLAPVPGASGRFNAIGNGPVTVTATYGPRVAAQPVVVRQRAVSLAIQPPATTTFASFDETKALTAAIVDARGVPVEGALDVLSWTSSNPGVAIVDDGDVVAVGNGTTWIIASSVGQRDSVRLTVQQVPAVVEFDDDEYEIQLPGGSIQTVVTVEDALGNRIVNPVGLVLASSRNSFTISPAGLVKAAAWGSTDLTASIGGLQASAVARVIGGTAPTLTRAAAGLTAIDRLPGVTRFLIAELAVRDGELDLDRAEVNLYSNVGNFMGIRVAALEQGAFDQEITVIFESATGAGTLRTTLRDAAQNASALSITPVVAQPQGAAPNVFIQQAIPVPGGAQISVSLSKGPTVSGLRNVHVFAFTADHQLVHSEFHPVDQEATSWAGTVAIPAGSSAQYIGVTVSDVSGNFSIIRTQDIVSPVAGEFARSGDLAILADRATGSVRASMAGGLR